jgi:putative transposase
MSSIFNPGQTITWRGSAYRITRLVNLYNLLASNVESGELQSIPIAEVQLYQEKPVEKVQEIDLSRLTDDELLNADRRYKIIEPLLVNPSQRTRKDVQAIAAENNMSTATLYRWLTSFEKNNRKTSLVPKRRSDKGGSRLSKEQDMIVRLSIQEDFLKPERPTIKTGYKTYKRRSLMAGVQPCSEATFARRIEELSPKEIASRRMGVKFAREKFEPAVDEFPAAKFPLQSIQIDHTQPNVILVDDDFRKPIGRPWVTFSIDVFSRVIAGFHLSLAPPSATSVAMCLSHAMCRKDHWLALRNIEGSWPVWGLFDRIYADNGSDFRSKALDRACGEYSIRLVWRPLGRPEYGGHVERLMRTVKTDLANLKGTTFRNPEDRGDYDSEGHAIFTFSEFERWLTIYIIKYYHQRLHSGIEMPPIKKFEEGCLYGSGDIPPVGLPDLISDEKKLYLDFLPYVERSVQRYGVEYDYIPYYHPSIAKWIGVKSPQSESGKHLFKYEEHQISFIYFLDPDTQEYFEIPRVRRGSDNMTRHQWRLARKRVEEQGKLLVNEEIIINAHNELMAIEKESAFKTKSVRRNQQRKKESIRATSHILVEPKIPTVEEKDDSCLEGDITPFDELDI